MKTCIFCDIENDSKSTEHIVPESLGNSDYILEKSKVCDSCNNRFSRFEAKALSNTIFLMERARFGRRTKKGKNAKGKVDKLSIEGDKNFTRNLLTVKGLDSENFINFNPETGQGDLIVKPFDKSEVATSKLLLKMGIESLFTSQKKIYMSYDFTDLRDYLLAKTNKDWPFVTNGKQQIKFEDIPQYSIKYKLSKMRVRLRYLEYDSNSLLFKFTYGCVTMIINLLNRDTTWMKDYNKKVQNLFIYPRHFANKTGLKTST